MEQEGLLFYSYSPPLILIVNQANTVHTSRSMLILQVKSKKGKDIPVTGREGP
jgi:hypothetical protein